MGRLHAHRRLVAAVVVGLIVVAVVVGLLEGGDGTTTPSDVPTLAQARADVRGAPAPIARLYAERGTAASGGVAVRALGKAGFQRLLRGLRGRPVLVNAWYPACPPCRREFPILRRAAATFGRQVAFVGLITDGSTSDVDAFLRDEPTVYPHVLDPGAQITRSLDAGLTFPSSILIDRHGDVVNVQASEYPSLARLERDLRNYVGIRPPAPAGTVTTSTTGGAAG